MNRFAFLSSFVCLFGLVACSSTDNSVGAMPGAGGSDGGMTIPDAAAGDAGKPPVIKCGELFNGDHNQCAAMDATSQGNCKCVIGFKWDGAQCVGLGGCECVGFDCAGIFTTSESCQAAHANCEAPVIKCGTTDAFKGDHSACSAMNAKGQGECYCAIGFVWDGAACTAINGCECVGVDCKAVFTDQAKCEAAHTECGVSLCSVKTGAPHSGCNAMNVKLSDETCNCGIKFYWDGSACVESSACTCVGTDCESVYQDSATCQQAHAACK